MRKILNESDPRILGARLGKKYNPVLYLAERGNSDISAPFIVDANATHVCLYVGNGFQLSESKRNKKHTTTQQTTGVLQKQSDDEACARHTE